MPKINKVKLHQLDMKDRRILTLLDEDSRQHDTKIAREIQKSPQFVRYRILQLQKNGVIIGTNAVIDYHRLGLSKHRLYIKLQNAYPEKVGEIAAYFVTKRSTNWVAQLDGSWDLGAVFLLPQASDFMEIWKEFRTRFGEFINSYMMSIIYEYELYPKRFLYPSAEPKPPLVITQEGDRTSLSRTEQRLVTLLAGDSRLSLISLAKRLGISSTSVAAKIRKLERQGILLGYRTNIRYKTIEHYQYRINVTLNDMGAKQALKQYMIQRPELAQIQEVYNGADFECSVIMKGHSEFLSLMADVEEQFKASIRTFTYYRVVRFYKSQFMIGGYD